jgi:NADPH:quinone reductase-like Zn-dependent oxidoreductase
MRALQIRGFGAPQDVLELIDLPEPSAPASGEVLIGVEHAPINMNDLYLIQGAYPIRPSLPSVVGNEGVGRVLAIGRGVDHLKVGDRVLVPLKIGSWRERLVAPAAGLFALPAADPRQLAMLGINPPTAALLLKETDLRRGDWVAQNAANSGVGRSVIAIAKARGISTINFVRRPELVPELEAAGGDLVLVDEKGALDKIRARVDSGRVPLGIDGVAGKASATIAGVLSESGTLVVYAMMSGEPVTIAPLDLIAKRVVAKGFFLNHPDVESKIPGVLRETASLVASGAIRAPIAATYPLTAFREAVAHVQRGGKVLFDVEGGRPC